MHKSYYVSKKKVHEQIADLISNAIKQKEFDDIAFGDITLCIRDSTIYMCKVTKSEMTESVLKDRE